MKFRQTFVFFTTVISLNLSQVFGYTFQEYSKIEFIEKKLVSDEDGKSLFSWNTPLSLIASHHLATMSDEELDSDWKLNDFFGNIIVINLPRSKLRLEEVSNELSQINTKAFHIFPAIDGRTEVDSWIVDKFTENRERYDKKTKEGRAALEKLHQGEAGCYLSHYTVLKKISERFDQSLKKFNLALETQKTENIQNAEKELKKYSNVLILEDDARFGFINEVGDISTRGAGRLLRKAVIDLPENWGMLYFVVQPIKETVPIAPHLYQISRSWSQCAYVVNHSMYKPLIRHLSLIEQHSRSVKPVDTMISLIHQDYNVYMIHPSIVFHKGNKSEITDKVKRPFWQPDLGF